MAKAPKPATVAAAPAQRSKNTVTVIYRPLSYANDATDPARTKWNGILFNANVPVELDRDNPAHYISQLLPKTYPGSNGETLTKHTEQKVFMGEIAKGNPSFEVDGKRVKPKKNTRVVPPPGAEWTDANEGVISDSDEIDRSVAA
jgi:hypothetical protein